MAKAALAMDMILVFIIFAEYCKENKFDECAKSRQERRKLEALKAKITYQTSIMNKLKYFELFADDGKKRFFLSEWWVYGTGIVHSGLNSVQVP